MTVDKAYDSVGLFVDEPNTISTWTRKRINPLEPKIDRINIEDIAHALARQCRYNGHCFGHLSVARHSLWVSDVVALYGPEMELWGLLHDAGEAYMGDMVGPMKHHPTMDFYREAEHRLDKMIADAFALPWPMPDAVHAADAFTTRVTEIQDKRHTWNSTFQDDERDFLARYHELQEQR
jgi:uncharacterized protein